MTKNIVPFALAIFILCAGCVTSRRCLDKFGTDTLRIKVRDTVMVTVQVPGDTVGGEITADSLAMLFAGKIDSLVKVNDSKDMAIKFWVNRDSAKKSSVRTAGQPVPSLPSLQFKAIKKPDSITQAVPVEVIAPCPPVVVVDCPAPKGFEKLWKEFQFFSAFLVLGGLSFAIIMLLIKKSILNDEKSKEPYF